MYSVFRTANFDKEIERRFSKVEIEAVSVLEQRQLRQQPYVGDPLGVRWLREKKLGGKRVYYLVYEELRVVLLVAVSDKKDQQAKIEGIRSNLEMYRGIALDALKRLGVCGRV